MSDWITDDALAILFVGWMISNVVGKYLGRMEISLGALVNELREIQRKTPAPVENSLMAGLESVGDTIMSIDRSVNEIKDAVDFFHRITMNKMLNEVAHSVKDAPEEDRDT